MQNRRPAVDHDVQGGGTWRNFRGTYHTMQKRRSLQLNSILDPCGAAVFKKKHFIHPGYTMASKKQEPCCKFIQILFQAHKFIADPVAVFRDHARRCGAQISMFQFALFSVFYSKHFYHILLLRLLLQILQAFSTTHRFGWKCYWKLLTWLKHSLYESVSSVTTFPKKKAFSSSENFIYIRVIMMCLEFLTHAFTRFRH